MKPKILSLSFLFYFLNLQVLSASGTEDFFRSIGKIYVVVAVVILLFLVIIWLLVRLEGKINKLEKRIKNE